MTFNTNFTTLNTRQIPIQASMQPNTTDVFILICVTTHAPTANPATHIPNFMMIPEGREFCFNISFSFLIILTFFFCVIRQVGRFCFIEQQKVLCLKQGCFSANKYARRRKEEDFCGNLKGSEHTWSKHYHTFALMNNRPNKDGAQINVEQFMEETGKASLEKKNNRTICSHSISIAVES